MWSWISFLQLVMRYLIPVNLQRCFFDSESKHGCVVSWVSFAQHRPTLLFVLWFVDETRLFFFNCGTFHIMYLVDCSFLISSNLFYYTLYFLKSGSYSKGLIRLNFVCWQEELMSTLGYFLLHHVVCYPAFRESKIDQWVQVVWPWSLHCKDSEHFS